MTSDLRKLVIDWLDDNHHFGDAEMMIDGDDNKSFMANGILDSMGMVSLIIYLESTCGVEIDRTDLRPENFDSLRRIVNYVSALPA